jgi:hypothetical protein
MASQSRRRDCSRKRDDQKVCRKAECRNDSASRDESISHAGSGHSVRTEGAYSGERALTCAGVLVGG